MTAGNESSFRDEENLPSRPSSSVRQSVLTTPRKDSGPRRPRILAMHGARSNDEVTRLQLGNLGITDDGYDIVYLRGPVEVEEGDPAIAGLIRGPYYSWFKEDEREPGKKRRAIISGVRDILEVNQSHGPFDGAYGFSSGAAMAVLAAGISGDPSLRAAVQSLEDEEANEDGNNRGAFLRRMTSASLGSSRRLTAAVSLRSFSSQGSKGKWKSQLLSASKKEKSRESVVKSLRRGTTFNMVTPAASPPPAPVLPPLKTPRPHSATGLPREELDLGVVDLSPIARPRSAAEMPREVLDAMEGAGLGLVDLSPIAGSIEAADLVEPPFKFVVLACAATPFLTVAELRRTAGLSVTHLEMGTFSTPSFHLIGIEDPAKAQSEEFVSLFANKKVMYMPGGHAVSREERKDEDLLSSLELFAKSLGNPPPKVPEAQFRAMSDVSDVALLPHAQVALVKLDRSNLPCCRAEGATIVSVFGQWPADRPFLHVSRDADPNRCTTYGDILEFIQGGKGDLRRIGVKPGEVVAYGTPPGGGAVPALAFLSIGAQTAAAPLAPGTAEPDALDALDQFQAKHLILFEGVDCPGVTEAFNLYVKQGKAKLHRAVILDGNKPGTFEFVGTGAVEEQPLSGPPLRNPEDGTCLLLRTSGTTARPKGVPLRQDALVNNGAILAASMQLHETDVCYSVMPLFHIGGISASILCTLASGGSVCCDGEPFDPSRMVDALAISQPQPTWYSSVPTIHNATVAFLRDIASSDPKYTAYGIDAEGVWKSGHSLRMIRSGAAALLGPDGDALARAYGGVPIYPTYSMSEQMPISQPPAGKGDTLTDKPGSVGVPIAASTAIVSRSTLRPVRYGEEGEIAISGPTVLKYYLDNPDADRKSYFDLTLDIGSNILGDNTTGGRYFLTGDVGTIDKDGFLSLKGRAKELIKKGGEQVSPFEVEEPLLDHPWIQTAVCFAVPSKLYGEEVGCALILSPMCPPDTEQRDITVAMRAWLREAKLAPIKWPTKWVVVNDEDLPKTKTKKYIRIGLSTMLGLDPKEEGEEEDAGKSGPMKGEETSKAKVDWACLSGLRMVLACYVMFMHIGSTKSWGKLNNLRGFPWHVHLFFTLGGYSMASPMNPIIRKKFAYFKARIWSMYPMYVIALIFGLANLLVVCRPSTFRPDFHWNGQPYDTYLPNGELTPPFCEGTPATKTSYWGSLILTIVTYIFGMAVTPSWLITWWLGYYLWFSSMYYQCLAFFPATYNAFFNRTRKNTRLLLKIVIGLMVLNIAILLAAWFASRDAPSYKDPDQYEAAKNWNIIILSFYLFGPFWALYFVIGAAVAFLYDAYRPAERHNAWIWGWVADGCSLVLIAFSFAHIFQGFSTYNTNPDLEMYMRPEEANSWTDTAVINRIWDAGYARMFCPLTTLWVFALSTGRGLSAKFFGQSFLSETLAPNSYNCFLFHQMVAQWYYAATRNGRWWNWWNYRKTMYWFSPQPCPTEWYEYFLVVGLVVAWSRLMTNLEPIVGKVLSKVSTWITRRGREEEEEEEDTTEVLLNIIEGMTGIEPKADWTLEECGLASIGIPALVALLNKNFSKKNRQVTVTAADLVSAETIADIVGVVDAAIELADAQGV